jgi:hypothetical protein
MVQSDFDDMREHTKLSHLRCSGPSQIMQPPRGQGLRSTITLTTPAKDCLVKAFFALAPTTEASLANPEYEISALAFWLTLDDGAGLRG